MYKYKREDNNINVNMARVSTDSLCRHFFGIQGKRQ